MSILFYGEPDAQGRRPFHSRVQWLQNVHERELPDLQGTCFLALREPHREVAFRVSTFDLAAAPGVRTRHHVPTAVTVTRRIGTLAGGTPTTLETVRSGEDFFVLPPMSQPGSDTIVVSAPGRQAEYRLWYLGGRIDIRTQGAASPENHAFQAASDALQGRRNPPRRNLQLGIGLVDCTIRIPLEETLPDGTVRRLRWASSAEMTEDFNGYRYYGLIEFRGTVEPDDAPGTFCFRRIIRRLVDDPPRVVRSYGDDDTSPAEFQVVMTRGPGHRAVAHCWDTDGPGKPLTTVQTKDPANPNRALPGPPFHRETSHVEFAQLLTVGDALPTSETALTRRPGLRRDDPRVIAVRNWRFDTGYEIITSPSTITDTPTVRSIPGFDHYVGPDPRPR